MTCELLWMRLPLMIFKDLDHAPGALQAMLKLQREKLRHNDLVKK